MGANIITTIRIIFQLSSTPLVSRTDLLSLFGKSLRMTAGSRFKRSRMAFLVQMCALAYSKCYRIAYSRGRHMSTADSLLVIHKEVRTRPEKEVAKVSNPSASRLASTLMWHSIHLPRYSLHSNQSHIFPPLKKRNSSAFQAMLGIYFHAPARQV